MPNPIPILLLITLLFVSPIDLATDLAGKVVGVSDGDTITGPDSQHLNEQAMHHENVGFSCEPKVFQRVYT